LPADTENIHIITWSQLNRRSSHNNQPHAPFSTKQDRRSEYSTLSSVTIHHTLIVYQVFRDVGRCVQRGSCSLSSLKWKIRGQYW